ncbi:MAG: hypothetical protein IKE91_00995 [Clostridia bacterium]|nr:hypothetical protein [Clostridia bacterium]
MIEYTNNLPNKVDYYDLLRTVYEDIDVSELASELENTIACVSVYNGERLVGMGRVKRENNYLCIDDLIVKLEDCREEIQNNIIVKLFNQVNQIKHYDVVVRDCLNMTMSSDDVLYKTIESKPSEEEVRASMENQIQLNGYVGV